MTEPVFGIDVGRRIGGGLTVCGAVPLDAGVAGGCGVEAAAAACGLVVVAGVALSGDAIVATADVVFSGASAADAAVDAAAAGLDFEPLFAAGGEIFTETGCCFFEEPFPEEPMPPEAFPLEPFPDEPLPDEPLAGEMPAVEAPVGDAFAREALVCEALSAPAVAPVRAAVPFAGAVVKRFCASAEGDAVKTTFEPENVTIVRPSLATLWRASAMLRCARDPSTSNSDIQ